MSFRGFLPAFALVLALLGSLMVPAAAATEVATPAALCEPTAAGGPVPTAPSGGFHGLSPERVLDTRATLGMIPGGCTTVVDLATVVPASATGAALDVVAVDAAGAGFVTVYPCGSARPWASNLNPRPGDPTPNAVVLPVDGTRRACLYTSIATQLVVDVTGWFGPGGSSFHEMGPERALDTRTSLRPDGGTGPVPGDTTIRLPLAGLGSVPGGATGVVVNLTATDTTMAGFLTAYPCGTSRPLASTGNYLDDDTRANQAFIGLGDGDLCVYSSATTNLVVDVAGWFAGSDGERAKSLTGTRVLDSRDGTGGWVTPIGAGAVRSFDPTLGGTVPVGATAILNVVATGAIDPGFVTLYPCGGTVPPTSSVNVEPGTEATNVAVVPLGDNGLICVYSMIATDLVIDVSGSFGAAGPLQSLAVSPGPLTPAFSPDGRDYGVLCATGANAWTVEAQAPPGGTVKVSGADAGGHVTVTENDLVTVTVSRAGAADEQYFVRCLPHDFPTLAVTRPDDPTPGWYLTSTGFQAPAGTTYALILDDHGAPVWYQKTPALTIDTKLLPDGNLAWVNLLGPTFGIDPAGAYQERALDGTLVHSWATSGTPTDHHDMVPLANGNMMMISYHVRTNVDLTPLGGTYGPGRDVVDGWLQEIRPDGSVAWSWHSEDHIGVAETTAQLDGVGIDATIPAGQVTDLLHINSIDVDEATGDVIVSARHLDAVFRVRRDPGQPDDGKVLWKLGGNAPTSSATEDLTIENDPLGGPARQHDARLSADGHLTMYDNRLAKPGQATRVVDYVIDPTAGTARLVWQFTRPDGQAAFGLGSLRRQADGSSLIGWGGLAPLFTELGPWGTTTLEVAQLPNGWVYRAVKEPPSAFDAATLRANAGK